MDYFDANASPRMMVMQMLVQRKTEMMRMIVMRLIVLRKREMVRMMVIEC